MKTGICSNCNKEGPVCSYCWKCSKCCGCEKIDGKKIGGRVIDRHNLKKKNGN